MMAVLDGIKVLEISSAVAVPMAGRLLADWGADVIQVVLPTRMPPGLTPEEMRAEGLRKSRATVGGRIIETNINHRSQDLLRNKKQITLDLSKSEGRAILDELIAKSDILLTNFRDRELSKFKLQYEDVIKIKPDIITASVNGYGRLGADKDLPGFEDTGFFARAGIFHVLQQEGMSAPPFPIGSGDSVTGLMLTYGMLLALIHRQRTGEGQDVNVSLFQTGVFFNSSDIGASLVTGQDRQLPPRESLNNAMVNFYKTSDGRWLRLAIYQTDLYWPKFCKMLGRPEMEADTRFDSLDTRMENRLELFRILEETFLTKTVDEWGSILSAAGIPWAKVQTLPEVCQDPQARANDFFVAIDHPVFGKMEVISNPVHLSKVPYKIRKLGPDFSGDTTEVLIGLGHTQAEIDELRSKMIIA